MTFQFQPDRIFSMEQEKFTERATLPFSISSLKESGISEHHIGKEKLFESPELPGKIIRVEHLDELREKHNNKLTAEELVRIAEKLFSELNNRYHITVPVAFHLDSNSVYEVVDKVVEMGEVKDEKKEALTKKVASLYKSISQYFFDKLQEGGPYLWDVCGSSQYIYGKREEGGEDNIYLIDTDIWLGNTRSGLCLSMYWLTRHISGAEQRLGTKFDEARNIISKFVETVPENLSNEEEMNISGVKDFLNSKRSTYSPASAIPSYE